MNKNLAIIPARGGSEGIVDKNIKEFAGKPLIAWTIELAKSCDLIDRVIVSTDSEDIASISERYGAEVPFLRPTELSSSEVAIEPVISHAYSHLKDIENYQADSIILLFPTNPLRQKKHIQESLTLFNSKDLDSVISVNESPAHYTPYWTLIKNKGGKVTYFDGTNLDNGYKRRQDFPEICFAKNDLIFIFKPENIVQNEAAMYGQEIELYETDILYSGDINSEKDWDLTLSIFKKLHKHNN